MKWTHAAIGVMLVCAMPAQKPARQFMNPEGLPKTFGYTHVVTSRPGRMMFISGQGGAAGGQMPKDVTAQAENTFKNMGTCLAGAGAKFEDIVKINYFVTDLANTQELRRVRAKYLNQQNPPAATLVQAGLGPGMLLEVEAIAIVAEKTD